MIEFIKKNKLFISSLSVLLAVIGFLGFQILSADSQEGTSIIEIPELEDPNDPANEEPGNETPVVTHKPASIQNFQGTFNDENNTITLSWSLNQNDSIIEKAELYNKDTLIADVTHNLVYEIPIDFYDITTGSNIFRLEVTLENEDPIYAETNVMVDYVFDVAMNHELTENEYGKGVLLTIQYTYHPLTPVGVPSLSITRGQLVNQVIYVGTTENVQNNEFINSETTYFVPLSEAGIIDWDCRYSFASVGLSFDHLVHEEITEDFIGEDIPQQPEEPEDPDESVSTDDPQESEENPDESETEPQI